MNKVGIYFAYWCREWDADYIYYINKVSKLGFDTLEICPSPLVDLPREKIKDIKKAADDCGIDLTYCLGVPPQYDMASEDISIRTKGLEYMKKNIETVGALDGKYFGGILYSAWPGALSYGIDSKQDVLDRSIESMREVIKTAENCGVTLCMEVVNRFEQILLNTAKEAVAYVDAIESPNCKILLDTYHMNIEEDDFREAILTAGDRLGHFHIGETNRKTPGLGKMDWDTITNALKEIGYKEHVVMEPFVKMGGGVGGDIKIWRDLSDNADEAKLDTDAANALAFIRSKLA